MTEPYTYAKVYNMKIPERDAMRLALDTGYSLQTVIKWYRGLSVLRATAIAIVRSAEKQGIEIPAELRNAK